MTIETTSNTISYTGDNSTTAFAYPYLFYANTHLLVTADGVTQVLDTDYTVSGAENENGGTVTFTTAPGTGVVVLIKRIVPYDQQTDQENFDGNPADVTEKQFDLCVMMSQQLAEETDRAILVPTGTTLTSNEISGTIDATTRLLTLTTSGPATTTLGSISTTIDTTFTSLADNDLLQYNSSSGNWENVAPGSIGILTAVVDDTTPQLGGNLDVNGNSIVSASNGNIPITPHGTGKVILDGLSWPTADGTADQYLKTDGSGNIGFATFSSSGGLVLLGSYTASNATSVDIGSGLDLDAAIDGTYDVYVLKGVDVVPATDQVALYLRTSSVGGPPFASSTNYENNNIRVVNNSETVSVQTETGNIAIEIMNSIGNVSGESCNFTVEFYNPAGTTNNKMFNYTSSQYQATTSSFRTGQGIRLSTSAIDALRILMNSGNIASGKFYLYGVRKS